MTISSSGRPAMSCKWFDIYIDRAWKIMISQERNGHTSLSHREENANCKEETKVHVPKVALWKPKCSYLSWKDNGCISQCHFRDPQTTLANKRLWSPAVIKPSWQDFLQVFAHEKVLLLLLFKEHLLPGMTSRKCWPTKWLVLLQRSRKTFSPNLQVLRDASKTKVLLNRFYLAITSSHWFSEKELRGWN